MTPSNSTQPRRLTSSEVGGRIRTENLEGEIITRVNPYNNTTWDELVITPEMNVHPNAAIIIVDGEQHMISKSWAGALRTQGSIEIYDPNLRL
ncbi:MAG: hypothetical protein LUD17_16510 [Bacteroidales bacterium]|nr:hypothetical protein [Bacteroidales bacterium]